MKKLIAFFPCLFALLATPVVMHAADFKLCAPFNTTVEGRVEGGKITTLKVTPESRRADVVIAGK